MSRFLFFCVIAAAAVLSTMAQAQPIPPPGMFTSAANALSGAFSALAAAAGVTPVTTTGTQTSPNCSQWSGSGVQVDAGSPCNGTPFNVKAPAYGALGTGTRLTDITFTSGSNTVTSTNFTFQTYMTGWYFGLRTCATLSSNPRSCTGTITVSSVGHTATISGAAPTSSNNSGTGIMTIGPDDTSHIQAAINAAYANGGGQVFLPGSWYITTSELLIYPGVSLRGAGIGSTNIVSEAGLTVGAPMLGNSNGTLAPYFSIEISGIHWDATDTSNTSTYNAASKIFAWQSSTNIDIHNNWLEGAIATCLGVDYDTTGRIVDNIVNNCGRQAVFGGTTPGGAGIGVATEQASTLALSMIIANNQIVMPSQNNGTYCAFFEGGGSASTPITGSYDLIANNVCFLYGKYQKGFAFEGTSPGTFVGNKVRGNSMTGQIAYAITNASYNTYATSSNIAASGNTADNVDIGLAYYPSINTSQPTEATLKFDGFKFRSVLSYAVWIQTANVQVQDVEIDGLTADNGGQCAINVTGSTGIKNLTIRNALLFNNATAATATNEKGAICIQTPVNGLRLMNSVAYDDQATATQQYGLIVDGSTSLVTNADVVGNDFSGNGTGGFSFTNSATVTGYWKSNKGLTSTVAGLASFPCSTGGIGSEIPVTDSLAPTYLGALTGGSTTATTAKCLNGSSWVSD